MAEVTFDGVRLDDADTITNWVADGTSPTQEGDYKYQGSFCVSGQVKKAEVGFYFEDPGTVDYAANAYTWIAKIIQINKDDIDGNGLLLDIGSAIADRYWYDIYPTSADYPATGGFQIIPIDPCISGYRWASQPVTGTPDPTAIDIYGIMSDAAQQAKSPNLGMDAVDYILAGQGLSLTGTAGVFEDFVDYDEGSEINRFGVVTTKSGIIYVTGTLRLASQDASSLVFDDSNRTIVWPDGRFRTGSAGLHINLGNATTDIVINSCAFTGRGLFGADGDVQDTRPILSVDASLGTATISSSNFISFNEASLSYTTTLDQCVFVEPKKLYQRTATIVGCTFNEPSTASGVAFLVSDNMSAITNSLFISSSEGHAIEIITEGTYDFEGINHEGYDGSLGTNETPGTGGNEAMIYNNSGGLVTLNLGATSQTPTIRNAADASTVVASSITLSMTVQAQNGDPIENAKAYIDDPGNTAPFIMNQLTDSGGLASTTWTGGAVAGAYWRVRLYGYKPFVSITDIETSDKDIPVTLIVDPQQT